jgi:hypothetical protein
MSSRAVSLVQSAEIEMNVVILEERCSSRRQFGKGELTKPDGLLFFFGSV